MFKMCNYTHAAAGTKATYLFTYLLTYFLTYLLAYVHTHSLSDELLLLSRFELLEKLQTSVKISDFV